jgi:hypothetical protein
MFEHHEHEITAPERRPPDQLAALYQDASAIWNGVSASVIEIHQGLTRTTMKLTAGPSDRLEGAHIREDPGCLS